MQSIKEVALKSGKTTALQPSTQLSRPTSTQLEQVRALMAQMKANYPNQELTPETVQVWMPQWLSMVKRYGLQEFQRALTSLLTSSSFFPQPHEIEDDLEYLARERNRAERNAQRKREMDSEFWAWVDERIAVTGKGEQALLDEVRIPGYIGMKARGTN